MIVNSVPIFENYSSQLQFFLHLFYFTIRCDQVDEINEAVCFFNDFVAHNKITMGCFRFLVDI